MYENETHISSPTQQCNGFNISPPSPTASPVDLSGSPMPPSSPLGQQQSLHQQLHRLQLASEQLSSSPSVQSSSAAAAVIHHRASPPPLDAICETSEVITGLAPIAVPVIVTTASPPTVITPTPHHPRISVTDTLGQEYVHCCVSDPLTPPPMSTTSFSAPAGGFFTPSDVYGQQTALWHVATMQNHRYMSTCCSEQHVTSQSAASDI